MGVVSWRQVWLVSGIYGCSYQEVAWLECIDVVSGCCCKKVLYKFPHITYNYIPTPLIYLFFLQQHPTPTSLFI